jgi:hypothetical protein
MKGKLGFVKVDLQFSRLLLLHQLSAISQVKSIQVLKKNGLVVFGIRPATAKQPFKAIPA